MTTRQGSNLKQALKELQGKHDKWKAIGQALCVPSQEIAIIEHNHRDDDERCLEEVLQYWIRNHPDSSWETLAGILNSTEEIMRPTESNLQTTSSIDQGRSGHRLGSDDMDMLMAVIEGVAPRWREVARGLGFSHEEVEMVLSDTRHQSQLDYLEETLSQWLRWEPPKGHPYPHTEDLVRTLRLEEVGEYGVAEEVERHPVFMSQSRTKGVGSAEQGIPLLPKKQKLHSSDTSQREATVVA
eukprot:Em0005g221a